MESLIFSPASRLSGFLNAIGGGQLPVTALFATLPGVSQGASIWGTGFATGQHTRQVEMR